LSDTEMRALFWDISLLGALSQKRKECRKPNPYKDPDVAQRLTWGNNPMSGLLIFTTRRDGFLEFKIRFLLASPLLSLDL